MMQVFVEICGTCEALFVASLMWCAEQVQPDLEDLAVNMEDNEGDGAQAKSLGKLQFSLDYDFQKGEVKLSLCFKCH